MQDWALRESNDGETSDAEALGYAMAPLWKLEESEVDLRALLDNDTLTQRFEGDTNNLFQQDTANFWQPDTAAQTLMKATDTQAGQVSASVLSTHKTMIKPQLHIHISKKIKLEPLDKLDLLQPRLDKRSLCRLATATLQKLGIQVDIGQVETISPEIVAKADIQLVPPSAQRLMTVMLLGLSGEKEVSQTAQSQITNGDLIALQQLVSSVLSSRQVPVKTSDEKSPQKQMILSDEETKEIPAEVANQAGFLAAQFTQSKGLSPLCLRLYRAILNMLFSTPDSWPFVQPVPTTATVYHKEIKKPMDLSTIERNVWKGKYLAFSIFEQDVQLVWQNAKAFHQDTGCIPRHADRIWQLFYKVVQDIRHQMKSIHHTPGEGCARFDPTGPLMEEGSASWRPPVEILSSVRTIYTIASVSPQEPRALFSRGNEKDLCTQFNAPFFDFLERCKEEELVHAPLPRFYVAKNRRLLEQAIDHGIIAILYKTSMERNTTRRIYHVRTNVVFVQPASDLFEMSLMNQCTDELAPKGWIHVRPIQRKEQIEFDINDVIERDYFRRMFTTCKLPPRGDVHAIQDETERLLVAMTFALLPHLEPEQDQARQLQTMIPKVPSPSPDVQYVPENSEMTHPVWKRLISACESKDIAVVNITQQYPSIDWNEPHSEGFFKQVYFLQDTVVQTFREMTMLQRVIEVSCLMKLKGLDHMAQMKQVLYSDGGDIVGLSMERYQSTLKEFAHLHSHHRLSAYQKFDIVIQMLECLQIIHDEGLGHRDLSEVNFMVNTIQGQLEDGSSKTWVYLIDFGKSIFCQEQDVRDWLADVQLEASEQDELTPKSPEELEEWCKSLPWVKSKPDHGYRMYRSIQTMPRTRQDNQVLPQLIHPQAEDMYSIGVMIWKLFSETEPWRGIMDTDVQGLRYVAEYDYRIQQEIESQVNGERSRELLLMCLKTQAEERASAKEILTWLQKDDVREGLIHEWQTYSSVRRSTRKAISMYGFDDNEPRKKPNNARNPRGRLKMKPPSPAASVN